MFRTNLVVRHQEHGIIYCITQFGTIVQASPAALKLQASLAYNFNMQSRQKNRGIKIDYKNLCILLVINTNQNKIYENLNKLNLEDPSYNSVQHFSALTYPTWNRKSKFKVAPVVLCGFGTGMFDSFLEKALKLKREEVTKEWIEYNNGKFQDIWRDIMRVIKPIRWEVQVAYMGETSNKYRFRV